MTALPIEMRAVRAHLADLGSAMGRGGFIYECGQFSSAGDDWLVVVAQSGAGNHPAQSVVTYAHIDFEDFEILIFIGVGGSRKAEAPIGSVIASNRVYFPYGGKYGDEGYSSRPRVSEVENRLVQLAYKVDRDGEWQGRILPPLKGALPSAENYPQPYARIKGRPPEISVCVIRDALQTQFSCRACANRQAQARAVGKEPCVQLMSIGRILNFQR